MDEERDITIPLIDHTNHHGYNYPQASPLTTLKMKREPLLYLIFKYLIAFTILLPVRVILTILIMGTQLLLVNIGTAFLRDHTHLTPLATWRKVVMWPAHKLCRVLLFTWGFWWIPEKGKAERNSCLAPIVVGNHVTFFDGYFLWGKYNGSGISKIENSRIPIIGSFFIGTQCILIDRSSAESRKAGVQLISQRALHALNDNSYNQLLMFPEGTTTNGTSLIAFKPGAFLPGVPIQPVCMTYPNTYCDLTWPPNVNMGRTLFFTLCQFTNYMEVDYLPIYIPNDQEKTDAQLFANNVRDVMAKALQQPITEHSYDDCKLMDVTLKCHIPESSVSMIQMSQIEKLYKVKVDLVKELLREFAPYSNGKGKLSLDEFSNYLHLPSDDSTLRKLFNYMDRDVDQYICFNEFIIGYCKIKGLNLAELQAYIPDLDIDELVKIKRVLKLEDNVQEESVKLDIDE